MEREIVIEALECCSKRTCDNCPNNFGDCVTNLLNNVLSLIKELTEENERLRLEYAGFEGATKQIFKILKADTVKKMQERVKEEAGYFGRAVAVEVVDQIAKEMLEGEK